MKIVFLSPVGAIGGAERVLLDCLSSLRAADPALGLHVVIGSEGPLAKELGAAGVESTLLPMPASLMAAGDSALIGRERWLGNLRVAFRGFVAAGAAARYSLRMRSLIRELAPDIVHSNGIKFHLLTSVALGRRRRVVWHLHDFLGQRPLVRRLCRLAAGRVAGAIAISEAVARDARPLLPRVPIDVIPNAIDVERFRPGDGDGAMLDTLAGLPPDNSVVRIGLIATYARWKGQDVFLDALARLPATLRWRGYIIGGPVYRTAGSQFSEQELRHRLDALRLRDRVGLIGFQHDTPAIYRALDIVVHASTRPEPFGLTIVEAMACGRPVIVSSAGGAAELFTDGVDALGVVPGDADSLGAAMVRLITDSALRQALGIEARQTATARFNRKRLGPRFLAAYRRLLR